VTFRGAELVRGIGAFVTDFKGFSTEFQLDWHTPLGQIAAAQRTFICQEDKLAPEIVQVSRTSSAADCLC
jgi:hypothetical protein